MKITKENFDVFEKLICDMFVDQLMSKIKISDRNLLSIDQQTLAYKEIVKAEMQHYIKSVQHGLLILKEKFSIKYPNQQNELERIDKPFVEELLLNSDKLLSEINQGLVFWQIFGLSKEYMEKLHGEAVELYTNHQFDEASDAFLGLLTLNHWDQRCWIGYGLSEQYSPRNNIERALDAFYIAIGLDDTNPYPYLYFAEGLIEKSDYKDAMKYLDLALKNGAGSDELVKLKPLIEKIKADIRNK